MLSTAIFVALLLKGLPIEVTKDVEYAREVCLAVGNDFIFDEQYLSEHDINEDGRPDYVVSGKGYNCGAAAESLFGGSAGMPLYLYLSNSDGGWDKAFNGYAFEHRVKQEYGEAPYFDVWIKGSVGYQVNFQRYQWDGEELTIIEQESGVEVPTQLWKNFD